MLPFIFSGGGVFTDDFNRGDSATIGNDWSESSGPLGAVDWDIVTNRLKATGVGGTASYGTCLRPAGENVADGYAQAVTTAGNTTGGPMMRATGATNGSGYWIEFNSGTTNLMKSTGTQIGSYAGGANGDTFKLSCVGTAIKVFINTVERISATDSAWTTGMRGFKVTGMQSAKSRTFDDYEQGT